MHDLAKARLYTDLTLPFSIDFRYRLRTYGFCAMSVSALKVWAMYSD